MTIAPPDPELAAEAVRLLMMHALYGDDLSAFVSDGAVVWPVGGRSGELDDMGMGEYQVIRQALVAAGAAVGERRAYRLTRDFEEIGPLFESEPMPAETFATILRAMISRMDLPSTRKAFEPAPGHGPLCRLLAATDLLRLEPAGFRWTDGAAEIMDRNWDGLESVWDQIEILDAVEVERMWETLPDPIREVLFPPPPDFKEPGLLDVAMVIGTYWCDGWAPWPWEEREWSMAASHSQLLIAKYRKAHGVEEKGPAA